MKKNDLANRTGVVEINDNIKTLVDEIASSNESIPWNNSNRCEHVKPAQYGAKDTYYCMIIYSREMNMPNANELKREINSHKLQLDKSEKFKDIVIVDTPNTTHLMLDSSTELESDRYGTLTFNFKKHYSKLQKCAINYKITTKYTLQESVKCRIDTKYDYTQLFSA